MPLSEERISASVFDFFGAALEMSGEAEGGASAERAFYLDLAAHELDDLRGNRESEPSAAMAPSRGIIGLMKWRKELVLRLESDSRPGIAHGEFQNRRQRGFGFDSKFDCYFTVLTANGSAGLSARASSTRRASPGLSSINRTLIGCELIQPRPPPSSA
jgi:hypothetical protein